VTGWKPKAEGDIHPKCGTPVVRKQGMFHFRGWTGDGLVCSCPALWSVPDEPDIFDVAAEMKAVVDRNQKGHATLDEARKAESE
jgi:hypothetical protein